MPRPVAVLLVLALASAGACSSSDDESASPTSSTSSGNTVTTSPTSTTSPPAWIASVTDAEVVPGKTFEGVVLWIDEPERTVFVQDCDVARRATAEGGPYGPVDGPGFAYICQ